MTPPNGPHAHRPVDAYLNLLVTMVMFGSAFASSKVVVGEIPHQVAAALRFGGGSLILIVLVFMLRGRLTPIGHGAAIRAGLLGLVGVFAYNVFFFWGLSLAPSLDGSIIQPVLSPILTVTALMTLGRERASWGRLAGLAVGVVGAVIFFLGMGAEPQGSTRLIGDLIFMLGSICWATYSILSKSVLAGVDPLQATAWGTGLGTLGLVAIALPFAADVSWQSVSGLAWGNVIFLAVGPTAIAYLFYLRGLRKVSPSVATIMMFTIPIFGSFFSTVFLGERFTALQFVGAVIMLLGGFLAVLGFGGSDQNLLPPRKTDEPRSDRTNSARLFINRRAGRSNSQDIKR